MTIPISILKRICSFLQFAFSLLKRKSSKLAFKFHSQYIRVLEDCIKPFLEEVWYLRFPTFVAILSIFFFAKMDQTLEVYRVFALNPGVIFGSIFSSFVFIFLLSLSIWYSGRALSIQRSKEHREATINEDAQRGLQDQFTNANQGNIGDLEIPNNHRSPSEKNTRRGLWLKYWPRIIGSFPLFSLFCGLIFASSPWMQENKDTDGGKYLFSGILISTVLLCLYFSIVIFREKLGSSKFPLLRDIGDQSGEEGLFSLSTILGVVQLSTLCLSIFALPLIESRSIKLLAVKLIVSAVVICVFVFLIWQSPRASKRTSVLILFLIAVLTIPLGKALLEFPSTTVPSLLGPVSVVAIFLSILVIIGSFVFFYGYKLKIPFITLLIICALVFSFFDINDNHRIRESSVWSFDSDFSIFESYFQDFSSSKKMFEARSFEQQFEMWRQARASEIPSQEMIDKQKNSDRQAERNADPRYPIYIISAQGGGIFAAYHAALTLSRLQDSCPAFARHIFAISGVSGGSLGATVFSSLVKLLPDQSLQEKSCFSTIPKPIKLEEKARNLLDQDFLSPLLAAGLFPDFAQRFLPFPVESIDRARGLEYAFEHAWEHVFKEEVSTDTNNPLRESYYSHWDPGRSAPALILNTTVVETGDRLVLSPFKIDLPSLKDIRTVACKDNLEFPLSTAAILSARFTLVTPAGWFDRCDTADGKKDYSSPRKSRLVDGGYFENSGVSTALDIGSRAEELIRSSKLDKQVKVVYLAITDQPYLKTSKAEDLKTEGLNELMSPVKALWNSSMKAKGQSVIDQAEYLLDALNADPYLKKNQAELSWFDRKYRYHRFRQFYLHDKRNLADDRKNTKAPPKRFDLPLGWFLSHFSQKIIEGEIGSDHDCSATLKEELTNNGCVFRSIQEEITLSSELLKRR